MLIRLPDWLPEFIGKDRLVCASTEDKMRFALGLARENVKRGTGGPFGAAVFDDKGQLIAPGVNLVESQDNAILHAEIVALMLSEKILHRYDLGKGGRASFDLVSSAEPCIMCFGAVVWSGVGRLICGARDKDVRDIGFDEGPKFTNWTELLASRGIEVIADVLREEAAAILKLYADNGGKIYNAGKRDDEKS